MPRRWAPRGAIMGPLPGDAVLEISYTVGGRERSGGGGGGCGNNPRTPTDEGGDVRTPDGFIKT